jgi:hypothetical protein
MKTTRQHNIKQTLILITALQENKENKIYPKHS